MAGTRAGGIKASITNKQRHGDNFYVTIGRKGGIAPTTKPKGFAFNSALASIAGRKGGLISKRGKAKKTIECEKTKA